MKLSYRGVTYEYTPPVVAGAINAFRGQYRGIAYTYPQTLADPSGMPGCDLTYRGANYHRGNGLTVQADQPLSPAFTVDDLARNLMMGHHDQVKNREQSLLVRSASEIGLDVATN